MMKADVEVYKGIEFVRLSSLTREHAKAIRDSAYGKKVIKILQGSELLPDCLPWTSYSEWFDLSYPLTSLPADQKFATDEERLKMAVK